MENIVLSTLEEIKVYSDPYRLKIIYAFGRIGRPATVKEVADAMGEVPAKIHYHVKKLEKIGILKIVATKEINGIVAKYYETFPGEIHIRQSELEEPVRKVVMSEAHKAIVTILDEGRSKFLQNVNSEEEGQHAILSGHVLHMTKEEAKELTGQIHELISKYERKSADEGAKVFDLMLALSSQPSSSDPSAE